MISDVRMTESFVPSSDLVSPKFDDGFLAYRDVMYEPNMCVIFDVRVLTGDVATQVGWSVLPVFEPGGTYVATGAYQIPLFQGAPPPAMLEELANVGGSQGEALEEEDDEPEEEAAPATKADKKKAATKAANKPPKTVEQLMRKWITENKVRFTADNGSLCVRIIDDQREGEYSEPADQGSKHVSFASWVPPKSIKDFQKPTSSKTYKASAGKGNDPEDYVRAIRDKFSQSTGVPVRTDDDAEEHESDYVYSDSEYDSEYSDEDDEGASAPRTAAGRTPGAR